VREPSSEGNGQGVVADAPLWEFWGDRAGWRGRDEGSGRRVGRRGREKGRVKESGNASGHCEYKRRVPE
jgi:hypothetical protein